jgi:hypothetical protein
VLLPLLASLVLAVIGVLIVAKVAHIAMRRLGLELSGVLVWLGLAEAPVDDLALRRAQPSFGNRAARARLL